MITPQAAHGLAVWLLQEHPNLFVVIRQHQKTGKVNLAGLGDWSDALSSIGDTLGSAVSGVGNWLSNSANITALTNVGTAYLNNQAAQSVLQTQAARAQAGLMPAPITYTPAGVPLYQPTPGYTTPPFVGPQVQLPTGQYLPQLTPQALQTLQPSFLQKYGTWLMIGGAGVLALALLL
jgi:hypothetical protein